AVWIREKGRPCSDETACMVLSRLKKGSHMLVLMRTACAKRFQLFRLPTFAYQSPRCGGRDGSLSRFVLSYVGSPSSGELVDCGCAYSCNISSVIEPSNGGS